MEQPLSLSMSAGDFTSFSGNDMIQHVLAAYRAHLERAIV
jgi:phosphoenolpyruvate-protein kinase (PTS system EI component)